MVDFARFATAVYFLMLFGCILAGDPKVTKIYPRSGCVNGGSRITIEGRYFENDTFAWPPGNDKGNLVNLKSASKAYVCDIHPDGITSEKITCDTRAMVEDNYYVEVSVNGVPLSVSNYCSTNKGLCKFNANKGGSPTIKSLSHYTGTPEELVTVYGRIMTRVYEANDLSANVTNNVFQKIIRVYGGDKPCDMIKPEGGTYNLKLDSPTSKYGQFTCKLTSKFIGPSRISFLVQDYGRSDPAPNLINLYPKDATGMYLTHPVITDISPTSGSTQGSTYVTITGNGLKDNTKHPMIVKVGDVDCKLHDVSYTSIVCETPPQADITGSFFTGGGQGGILRTWVTSVQDTVLENIPAMDTSDSTYQEVHLGRTNISVPRGMVGYFEAYFKPPSGGKYWFKLKGDTGCLCMSKMSSTMDPSAATVLNADCADTNSDMTMTEGNTYYMQIIFSTEVVTSTDPVNIIMSMFRLDAPYNDDGHHNGAQNEIQQVQLRADKDDDIQTLTLPASAAASGGGDEIQTLTVTSESTALRFRLNLNNAPTGLLSSKISASDLQTAINALSSVPGDIVSVTQAETGSAIVYTVTFSGNLGNWAEFVVSDVDDGVTVVVAEVTAGQSDGSNVMIQHQNYISPPVPIPATATQMQTAVEQLFSVSCPTLKVPGSKYNAYEEKLGWNQIGQIVEVSEPFCGKSVLMNPWRIFYDYNIPSIQLGTNKWLCLAYRGIFQKTLPIYYRRYYKSGDTTKYRHYWFHAPFNFNNDITRWHYNCIDLKSMLEETHNDPASTFFLKIISISRHKLAKDGNMIDEFMISSKPPIPNFEDITNMRAVPAVRVTVSVVKSSTSYTITMDPLDCKPVDLLSVRDQPTGGVTVQRTQTGSLPPSGKVKLSRNSIAFEFNADASDAVVQTILDTNDPSLGRLSVNRYGTCHDYEYRIEWLNKPGNQEQFQIDASELVGPNVVGSIRILSYGGAWYTPIPGYTLHKAHIVAAGTTQYPVTVEVNYLRAACDHSAPCLFTYSSDQMPTVTDIQPRTGTKGTMVVVTGSGFDSTAIAANILRVGRAGCEVTSATGVSFTCTLGVGEIGTYGAVSLVRGKGAALIQPPIDIVYTIEFADFTPTTVGIGGGLVMNLTGTGLDKTTISVEIGGTLCPRRSADMGSLQCVIPAAAVAGSVDVVLKDGSSVLATHSTQLVYDSSITPIIQTISATTGSPKGGQSITVTGTGFGGETLRHTLLVDKTDSQNVHKAKVTLWSDTTMEFTLPPLPDGTYTLIINIPAAGYATKSDGELYEISSTFLVTGIDPKETSAVGGLKFTITGSGFTSDTSVKFGEIGCEVKSVTSTEIICQLDEMYNTHQVKMTDQENGYQWDPASIAAEFGDVIHWSWDSISDAKFLVQQTNDLISTTPLANGFINNITRTRKGECSYKTMGDGAVYYTSGMVSAVQPEIIPRGQINVVARAASVTLIHVTEGDVEAKYTISSGGRRRRASSCASTYQSGCVNALTPNPNDPSILLNPCLTTDMNAMAPNSGTTATDIVIGGTGFGTDVNCVNVHIQDKLMTVVSVTDTEIRAKINPDDPPAIHIALPVTVEVLANGYAKVSLSESSRSFTLFPHVDSVTPTSGSLAGNTIVTIGGGGFVGNEAVNIDGVPCVIDDALATPTQIVCATGPRSVEVSNLLVGVTVQGHTAEACTACKYSYLNSATPRVTSVTPATVPDPSTNTGDTTLTINGELFSTDTSLITVEIGSVQCTLTAATATSIQCTVSNLPVNSNLPDGPSGYPVMINVTPYGNNQATTDNIRVTGLKLIRSVSPAEGSVMGDTSITLSGNGFHADATVAIDGAACPTTSISLSQVVCKTPAHTAGSVDVIVSTNGESYDPVTYTYSDTATPTVTSISPTSSYGLTSITISGTLFHATHTENQVTVNDVVCTPTAGTSTEITCQLGSSPAGTYPLVVSVPGYGLAQASATFTYDISISAISPNQGSRGGGQQVTLTGEGLSSSTIVDICDVTCTLVSASATEYICTTPSNSGTSGSTADTACDVTATSGSVTTPAMVSSYTYSSALTPTISGISPSRGGTGGGTPVTITGTNFGTDQSLLSVIIDDVACAVESISVSQFVCTTGPHPINIKASIIVKKTGEGAATYDTAGAAEFYYIDVYSSTFTWGGGPPPEKGDFVVIKEGQTLLIDVDTPVLKLILVQGTLMFDDTKASIELQAENILITNGGKFQIGTEDEPYQNKAIVTLHGHARTTELPTYGSKSIGLREGSLELHGKPTPVTWTLLDSTVEPGDTALTLQAPTNWNVGDEIVIASTGDHKSQHQNEKVEILTISNEGKSITFKPATQHQHLGLTEVYGDRVIELRAEVGVLTHNILIRGNINEEHLKNITACVEDFDPGQFATQTCFQGRFGDEIGSDQIGAHIIVHNPEENSGKVHVHIEHTELTFVGQAFRLGRYPIHFHRNGYMRGSYVRGSSIHKTFNRAVNIHNCHELLIENNVAYDIMGGAVFLEDGIEHGNTLERNLLLFVKASSSLLNDDITPAAFWITHPNNTVRHNHVAGGTHFGFWYRMNEHPDGPSFTKDICPRKMPLGEFYNNTVHSVGWYGLWIFEHYYPQTPTSGAQCSWNQPEPAVFRQLTTWNSFRGAEWVEGGAIQFVDFMVANNFMSGLEAFFIEKHVPKYEPNGAMWSGATVIGHLNYAGHPPCTKRGLVLPFSNGLLINNTHFHNFESGLKNEHDICAAIGTVKIICTCTTLCSGYNYKFRNIHWHNSVVKTNFEWENQAELEDLDGSLTGLGDGAGAGARVFAASPLLPSECVSETTEFGTNFPAQLCPASVQLADTVRLTFNNPNPLSLLYKDVSFTPVSDSGQAIGPAMVVPWADKRDTHPKGWLALLPINKTYLMEFVGMERITNFSYVGTIWGLKQYSFVRIMHKDMFKDDFDVFDQLQITSKVPAGQTNVMSTMPLYGDVDGSVYLNTQGTDKQLTYLISGEDKGAYGDTGITFQAKKCFYPGCVTPKGEESSAPPTDRPDHATMWSDVSTWTEGSVWGSVLGGAGTSSKLPPPSTSTKLTIAAGTWVVVDVSDIELDLLIVEGTLEFEYQKTMTKENGEKDYWRHTIKANHIVIIGGRLLAGYNNNNYNGHLDMILTGTLASPTYSLPSDGPNIGAKALGVFGAWDFHGTPHDVVWTKLKSTVAEGATSIILMEPVDWLPGDEIFIATTGYSTWETETRIITAVSASKDELHFEGGLLYRHLGESHTLNSYSSMKFEIRAEVALLSRNIRIMGADPGTIESVPYQGEAYGARTLVGVYGYMDLANNEFKAHVGYANLSNVQFKFTSQDGFVDPADARFSLVFRDLQDVENSVVANCSFDRGYGSAIGIFGTNKLLISNNVIYRAVGHGILDMGKHNRWIDNLAGHVLWPGTFNGRNEYTSEEYEGAFEGTKAIDPIIQGNTVAGAERAGFRVNGEHCDDVVTPAADRWTGNVAHSVMLGTYMMHDDDDCHVDELCSEFSNFVIYKAWGYGSYSQVVCSIRLTNMHYYDNTLGVLSLTIGPDAREHLHEKRYFKIQGGLFVGQSPSFDSSKDKLRPADENNRIAGVEASNWFGENALTRDGSARKFGKMGIAVPVYENHDNMAPDTGKHFHKLKKDPTTSGINTMEETHLAYFGKNSDGECDVIIATNPLNPDAEQPFTIDRVKMDSSVDSDCKVFIQSPGLSHASASECVDMVCEGRKAFFVIDKDGSFKGQGSILPDAAFEYNGNPTAGIGDYRIPIVLQTRLNGSKIEPSEIYQHRGIYGSDLCSWVPYWNAYNCPATNDYKRWTIQSMDEDHLDRRLSPMAMVCSGPNGLDAITISSNPRAVGICGGYACKERLSVFYVVGAKGTTCTLHFTSTTPQSLNLYMDDVPGDWWSIQKIYMGLQYRYDVSYNGVYVEPPNFVKSEGKYLRNPDNDPTFYYPKSTGGAGANYFDVERKELHVLIKGSGVINIALTPQIILAATFEVISEEDFFGKNIISNLANFLNIDASKIKIMDIISESNRRRRSVRHKRNAAGISVTFMIGNNAPGTSSVGSTDISTADLIDMSKSMILKSQIGSMSDVFGTVVSGVQIAKPPPSVSDTTAWQAYTVEQESAASNGISGLVPIYIPDRMESAGPTKGDTSYEGKPFTVTPTFKIMDSQDNLVTLLEAPNGNGWQVQASLDTSDPFANKDAKLTGATIALVNNGYVSFPTLGISHAGYNYKVHFAVINPSDVGAGYSHTMEVAVVPKRSLFLTTTFSKVTLLDREKFDVDVFIKESSNNITVPDLTWKGDTWTGVVYMSNMIDQGVELGGLGDITFHTYGNQKLEGLYIHGPPGRYAVSVIVRTNTADYAMILTTQVQLVGETTIPASAHHKLIELKYKEDFTKVQANTDIFLMAVYNLMKRVTSRVEFYNMAARNGSIIVAFTCHGEVSDVEAATKSIADEVKQDGSLRFGDLQIPYSPYMKVDSETYGGLDGEESGGLSQAVIIAVSVVGALLVITIIIVVVVVCCKKSKNKKMDGSDSTTDLKKDDGINGYGQNNRVYAQGRDPSIVFDEKSGDYKTMDESRPSSGYSSKGSVATAQSLNNSGIITPAHGKATPTNRKAKPAVVVVAANVSTGGRPLSSASRPSTGTSRPDSRTSIVSKQEIRTSFSPRLSVDEGAAPNTIPTIQD